MKEGEKFSSWSSGTLPTFPHSAALQLTEQEAKTFMVVNALHATTVSAGGSRQVVAASFSAALHSVLLAESPKRSAGDPCGALPSVSTAQRIQKLFAEHAGQNYETLAKALQTYRRVLPPTLTRKVDELNKAASYDRHHVVDDVLLLQELQSALEAIEPPPPIASVASVPVPAVVEQLAPVVCELEACSPPASVALIDQGTQCDVCFVKDAKDALHLAALCGTWEPMEKPEVNDVVEVDGRDKKGGDLSEGVFSADGTLPIRLYPGLRGVVKGLDEEGDCLVHFPQLSHKLVTATQCILKDDFPKLLKLTSQQSCRYDGSLSALLNAFDC
eukprot:TRINITY_DN21339_c0_g1_i5.p1 TRINITY_DN21339_c0_g1~~TRINITY_DN21339_c0_g1_i5.p1  ORF type:complete len:330 (-),score=55.81 TRINITY_DN21339_c0_g1_i5:37-1026(-)